MKIMKIKVQDNDINLVRGEIFVEKIICMTHEILSGL